MSFSCALNLTNEVQIARETISTDGMGGVSATTVLTTIETAAIWQAGSLDTLFSDQIMAVSTHVLATLPTAGILYTDKIVWESQTYEITGRPDNVLAKDVAMFTPMKLVN
jgi:hypothetical protein